MRFIDWLRIHRGGGGLIRWKPRARGRRNDKPFISVALKKYIQPAARAGRTRVAISVRDLMTDLRPLGFPQRNYHQICTAIQTKSFLRESGAEIESIEGPASKTSSTVVVHYLIGADASPVAGSTEDEMKTASAEETPEEWAHRVTGKLFGLMKEEFAAFGGGEAFLKWVRSEDNEAPA